MTFKLFILGLLIILAIAKYNKSNTLFWTLFTGFTLGFAVIKMCRGAFSGEEQSESTVNQAYPMQELVAMDSDIAFFSEIVYNLTAPVKETSIPASQVITPDYVELTPTLSNVLGVTQGLYLHALPNPPNTVQIVNDS